MEKRTSCDLSSHSARDTFPRPKMETICSPCTRAPSTGSVTLCAIAKIVSLLSLPPLTAIWMFARRNARILGDAGRQSESKNSSLDCPLKLG